MTFLQAVAYGLVQGLGEFLPISSSAHLALLHRVLDPLGDAANAAGDLAFDVALHMGTLVALLLYFREDIARLLAAFFRSVAERRIGDDQNRRLAWLVILGSVPGGLAGVLFEKQAEHTFRSPLLIASALIACGLVLWAADRLGRNERSLDRITVRDVVVVGVAQAFALIPGVSRSGSTISAARAVGLDREASARFSFLLAAPIIAGAGLIEVPKLVRAGGFSAMVVVGVVVSALTGYLAIEALLRLVRTRTYLPFVVYRVLLGLGVFAAVAWAR